MGGPVVRFENLKQMARIHRVINNTLDHMGQIAGKNKKWSSHAEDDLGDSYKGKYTLII